MFFDMCDDCEVYSLDAYWHYHMARINNYQRAAFVRPSSVLWFSVRCRQSEFRGKESRLSPVFLFHLTPSATLIARSRRRHYKPVDNALERQIVTSKIRDDFTSAWGGNGCSVALLLNLHCHSYQRCEEDITYQRKSSWWSVSPCKVSKAHWISSSPGTHHGEVHEHGFPPCVPTDSPSSNTT